MTSARMSQLLREAAKCFDEASSPFSTEWLIENNVSADECIDLSSLIGSAIRVYLEIPKDQRASIVMKQAISEMDIPESMKEDMLLQLKHKETLDKLKAWRAKD